MHAKISLIARWRFVFLPYLLLLISGKHLQAQQQPFPFLQPDFSQSLFSTLALPTGAIDGGIAFAPNSDLWVDSCNGNELFKFSVSTTTVVNGSPVHPQAAGSPIVSSVGCGLTNHPDGTLYGNNGSGNGIINVDASTGAQLRPAFGPQGNGLGIAVDPQTNNLVYVGGAGGSCFGTPPCVIVSIDTVTAASSTFAQLGPSVATFIDGIFFDPSGNFLFLAVRNPAPALAILDRSGAVVQQILVPGFPDGVSFHRSPDFVATNNNDGTISRFDFPGNDFAQAPVQSLLASRGFRGDLSLVGADGCLYATQDGSRFADGTVTSDNSVVRLCPNFVPAPGVTVLFADFDIRDFDIRRAHDDDGDRDDQRGFKLTGEFTPGKKSAGIDPLHQVVTLNVGNFSTFLPAGSFQQERNGHFVFKGALNGVRLDFHITVSHHDDDDKHAEFSFSVQAQDVNLTSLSSPVAVSLSIGQNTGLTATRK